ncbi:hypothetical protein BV898_18924 [Hypsibius exemplaris]|uniref:Uncharacterized protein n=1 Tax=Hypsibius exemplaris TaxID=2072580 RepID=A0A9X6NJP8_HYPEX|nr:hypothetical protein BV898_18924 [Hypsibius exemplaris]
MQLATLRKRSWFRSAVQPWVIPWNRNGLKTQLGGLLTREPPSALNRKKDIKFWMNFSDRIQANITENRRLSFLQSLRTNFAAPLRSQFLDVLSHDQATPILKILTSGHHSRVEAGRWVGLPRDARNCNHCGVLEDERHVLFRVFFCLDDLLTTLCTFITEM